MDSMTGYGRGAARRDGREITVELKAVNHRFLDLSFRSPKNLSMKISQSHRPCRSMPNVQESTCLP